MGIQIRKFQAATLQKAIEQIREELGDNAIILQTEPIKNPAAFGLLSRTAVEVTAAIDRKELAPRFHATVKDDVTTVPAPKLVEKSDWKSFFTKKSSKDSAKPAATTTAKATATTTATTTPTATTPTTSKNAAAVQNLLSKYAGATTKGETTSNEAAPTISQLYAMKTFIEPIQKEVETLKAQLNATTGEAPTTAPTPLKPTTPTRKRIVDPLELEMQKLRQDFEAFMNEQRYEETHLPRYFQQLMNFWTDRGMSTRTILRFFKGIEEWGHKFNQTTTEREALESVLMALEGNVAEANVLNRSGKRIVVLAGPTGVGKTTTIAKLAAYEKLRRKKTVTLLTLDDYKIGGTDQLAHYARILEVPFVKLRTDLSLEEQCRHIETDIIFIDTFGIAPKEIERMEALKKTISFTEADMQDRLELHLVLPVGIQQGDVPAFLEAFRAIRPDYLLFTKWDETANWGGMLTTILQSKKPVSFVAHGQSVPDDLSLFSKKDFIDRVTTMGQGTEE